MPLVVVVAVVAVVDGYHGVGARPEAGHARTDGRTYEPHVNLPVKRISSGSHGARQAASCLCLLGRGPRGRIC